MKEAPKMDIDFWDIIWFGTENQVRDYTPEEEAEIHRLIANYS